MYVATGETAYKHATVVIANAVNTCFDIGWTYSQNKSKPKAEIIVEPLEYGGIAPDKDDNKK